MAKAKTDGPSLEDITETLRGLTHSMGELAKQNAEMRQFAEKVSQDMSGVYQIVEQTQGELKSVRSIAEEALSNTQDESGKRKSDVRSPGDRSPRRNRRAAIGSPNRGDSARWRSDVRRSPDDRSPRRDRRVAEARRKQPAPTKMYPYNKGDFKSWLSLYEAYAEVQGWVDTREEPRKLNELVLRCHGEAEKVVRTKRISEI
jgi:ElaB/YqjD/DUF883 family membrane-anchored ribosome-binding protein